MSNPTYDALLHKQGYYPCLFFVCTHNHNHRHKCDQCRKHMLMGEGQILTAYYESTYGSQAKIVGYDITCRHCHPGSIEKGFHYGELVAANRVV